MSEDLITFMLQYLIFPLVILYCNKKWSDKNDR